MLTTTTPVIAVVLCRLAIGITGLIWLISGDGLRFSVAFIFLLLTFLPTLFTRHSQLREATAALIAVFLAAHIVLGMQMELYETSKWYDKAVHTLASSAIAGILIVAISTYCGRRRIELPLMLSVLLVLGGTLSAGALWELFEFAIDRTGFFHAQRGLHDTMLDLLADATGAVLATSVFTMTIWARNKYLVTNPSWIQ